MTHGEQASVLGEAALELAEQRKRLICLKPKADGYRRQLRAAIAVLEHSGQNVRLDPEPDEKRFPTLADVKEVDRQIAESSRRIDTLQSRLEKAGVIERSDARQ